MIAQARRLRIEVARSDSGTMLLDCGVAAAGGLAAGTMLAEICMAGLGNVALVPPRLGSAAALPVPQIQVATDHPVAACLAAQYAGWKVEGDGFFGMGSGPMRAAFGSEPLFDSIGLRETHDECVGVLESGSLPPAAVCRKLAQDCGVDPDRLTLLIAPTRSLAGSIQVVARSVETTLHKLHELNFDLGTVISGYGIAPLPPPAADDMTAIGRTNDAILYGGQVTLWIDAGDDVLEQVGALTPSSAASDHGRPFAEIFAAANYDFYNIDPLLFSPACVTLISFQSGHSHCFGELRDDVLASSFGLT